MIKKILTYLPWIILVFLGFYFIFTTSPHVRYWVDDFCSATFLRDNGFWGAQVGWWKSWTGRYSYIFFLDIFESIGPWVVKFLPILLLIGLIWAFVPVFFSNVIVTSLFTILLLINSPNIIQSFYWQTGSLNYTIPFIFLGIYLSVLISKKEKKSLLLPFITMFIAGGFNETFALAAFTLLTFIILGIWVLNPKDKTEKIKLAIAGLIGITVSLIVMSLAPGNAGRAEAVTKPESMLFVVKSTLLGTRWYLMRMLTVIPFIYSLIAILSSTFIFGRKIKIDMKKGLSLIVINLVAILAVTMAVLASGFYSMSILPPERALFVATSMLLLLTYSFSLLLTGVLNKWLSTIYINNARMLSVILSFVVSFLLIKSVVGHWTNVRSEVVNYAHSWDNEVNNLPKIHNIKPVGELDSFTDNKGWVQGCVAGYYGFESIRIVE